MVCRVWIKLKGNARIGMLKFYKFVFKNATCENFLKKRQRSKKNRVKGYLYQK